MGRLKVNQLNKLSDGKKHHDGDGLYLKCVSATARSWLLRTTIAGKEHMIGLGKLRDVPLATARQKASEVRRQIALGINPLTQRKEQRAADLMAEAKNITFEEATRRYFDFHKDEWRNPKHIAQFMSTMKTYVFPRIGKQQVADVTRSMVRDVLEQEVKDAKGRTEGTLWQVRAVTARRIRSRIEWVLDYAKASDWRPDTGTNPAAWKSNLKTIMTKRKPEPVNHAALDYRTLPDFMAQLRQREGTAARALEFLILCASRTGEIIGAKWDEIDFEAGHWTIPKQRMKTNDAHRVPLTKETVALLRKLPREDKNPFIFIGPTKGGLSSAAMTAVLRRMGFGHVTVHGMRSAFRDWGAERTLYAREILELSLAHVVKGESEAAYWRSDLIDKRRNLLADWASYVGTQQGEGKNVQPIRRAG